MEAYKETDRFQGQTMRIEEAIECLLMAPLDVFLFQEPNELWILHDKMTKLNRHVKVLRGAIKRELDIRGPPKEKGSMLPKNAGMPWDDAQIAWLLRYLQRHTIHEAAKRMERTYMGIRCRLLQVAREMAKNGHTLDEIVATTKLSTQEVLPVL